MIGFRLRAALLICLALNMALAGSPFISRVRADDGTSSAASAGTGSTEPGEPAGKAHLPDQERPSGPEETSREAEDRKGDVVSPERVPAAPVVLENEDTAKEHQKSAAEAPSESPAKQNEAQKPETIVDVLHAGISRGIQGTATWMDSFFGNRRYLSELNESYVRFRYNVFLEDRTGLKRKPEFQFRMVLPQLREKTRLEFAGTPRQTSEFSPLDSNAQSDQISQNEERNVSAAVHQTLRETARDNITVRAGLQLHDRKPAVMLGPRYRILFPFDVWNLRFVEEVLWRSNIGWEAKSTADLERPLQNHLFFRATNEWLWKEHVNGYTYAFIFFLGQPLDHTRGLEYEWVNVFQTKPVNELMEVTLRARYRQQFWREWLFFEISPQLRFPRDYSFDALPGILFRLEMIFGNYR